MTRIEFFENAGRNEQAYKEANINHCLYRAYRRSIEKGNDYIDFDDVVWESEIEEIVEQMRQHNISMFTVSSTFSSLLQVFQRFALEGCEIIDLIEVKDYPHFDGKEVTKPAMLFKIK